MLFGLTHAHGLAVLAYAIVEGVGFGLRDGCQTLSVESSAPITGLSLVGGGARSAWWAQLLADTLGLETHDGAQAGAALGAARLAWLASGGSPDDVLRVPCVAARFGPDPARHDALRAHHARNAALYAARRERFRG